jgi:hypothetical protein
MDAPERFLDQTVTLAGVVGDNVEIPSANPVNYYQAITDREMFMVGIDAGGGRWGAHIGSIGDQPEVFRLDMLAFHASVLDGVRGKG